MSGDDEEAIGPQENFDSDGVLVAVNEGAVRLLFVHATGLEDGGGGVGENVDDIGEGDLVVRHRLVFDEVSTQDHGAKRGAIADGHLGNSGVHGSIVTIG